VLVTKIRDTGVIEGFATNDFIQGFAITGAASFIADVFVRNVPNRAGINLTSNVSADWLAPAICLTRARQIARF
jgi:hypothetical protein